MDHANAPRLQQPELSDAGEQPLPSAHDAAFGSDAVADTLKALGIPYLALVPGSSMRGLHDSIVNRLGNRDPRLIVCLHEEASVAIAHGYAKITDKPMAAALHANVGLMHAVMSIYNAWCDRVPILLLGATGPLDAKERRPWIDWLHTSRDQAAIIRGTIKWDDLPASPAAAVESVIRAKWIAETVPMGPTYVNLDVSLQEARLDAPLPVPDPARLAPRVHAGVDSTVVSEISGLLKGARRPLILMGRVSRSEKGWADRVALAEKLGAGVATNLKLGAAFPTEHPLHVAPPGSRLPSAANTALREADVVLSLDWLDLAGTIETAFQGAPPSARIIQVSRDHAIHTGVHMDHQGLAFVDLFVSADPDQLVPALLKTLDDRPRAAHLPRPWDLPAQDKWHEDGMRTIYGLAAAARTAAGERPVTLTNLPLSWNGSFWPFRHPLDHAGGDGAAGIGSGPGIAVGEALALKGSGRLPIAICGDGDFVMGHTALWTAVHYGLPLLVIVANNRGYFNDVKHQEEMAETRGREAGNKWIGQRLSEPDLDLAGLARAQGAAGFGPVGPEDDLVAILGEAIAHVEGGGVAVVDVRIKPGYAR